MAVADFSRRNPVVPGLYLTGQDLMVEQAQNLAVMWALRETILERAPDVTPNTVLDRDANLGDTSVLVRMPDGPRKFLGGGVLMFYDLTDEEPIEILGGDPSIPDGWDEHAPEIPLSFRGLEYQGLQYAHPKGTRVGTNLFTVAPPNLDHMLDRGDGVLFMTLMRHSRYFAAEGGLFDMMYNVNVEYRRSETQIRAVGTDGQKMNPLVWSKRQQEQCELHIEQIADALAGNWSLMTPLGEVGIAQQDVTNPQGQIFDSNYTAIVVDGKDIHFGATGKLPIRARWKQLLY